MTQEIEQTPDFIDQAIQRAIEGLRSEGIQTITISDVELAAVALDLVVTPELTTDIADRLEGRYRITGPSGTSWQWSDAPSDQQLTREDLIGAVTFPKHR